MLQHIPYLQNSGREQAQDYHQGEPDVAPPEPDADVSLDARPARDVSRLGVLVTAVQKVSLSNPLKLLRSEEHTSELQSLMRISYAVFCLTKKTITQYNYHVSLKHQH